MKKIILLLLVLLSGSLVACSSSDDWDSSNNITLYTRDTSSGTRAGFMEGIGFSEAAEDNSLLAEGYVIKDNTGILTSMKTDEYGIGYDFFGETRTLDVHIKELRKKLKNAGITEPTIETIRGVGYKFVL
ncbi:MAG: winged helix-turn-helix domain-containing protein [Candidatus Izemoplasmatales bacterium]|jgi:ABC-type phosphate transport system substrate-binding protein|nr:winged helix-turn-helix domain-containing protein [Candidatus Izemoplasmatales bacterium]